MNDSHDYNVYYMGPDFVIAASIPDAWEVWCEHSGEDKDDYIEHDDFDVVEDDMEMSILCDEKGAISDNGERVMRTAHEWADREGRGFLCSTEF